MRTEKFYKTYSIGYPTKKDIEWATNTKKVLDSNHTILKTFLNCFSLTLYSETDKSE